MRKSIYNEKSPEVLPPGQEPYTELEATDLAQDDTYFDDIMEKMRLSEGQRETLNCYLSGMTFTEIAAFLSVNLSTVWRRRMQIQQKYISLSNYGN